MNALLKRIEKLEEANRPSLEIEALRIIRMVASPSDGVIAAICGGKQIDRNEGEQGEAFQRRASKVFNQTFNSPCIQSVDGDEEI